MPYRSLSALRARAVSRCRRAGVRTGGVVGCGELMGSDAKNLLMAPEVVSQRFPLRTASNLTRAPFRPGSPLMTQRNVVEGFTECR